MKNLKLLFVILMYCSCQRPVNVQQPTGTPVFKMYLTANNYSSAGSYFTDSLVTLKVNDSAQFSMGVTFSLISGNPESYPITCFITGLPTGVVPSVVDSVTFRLSYNAQFSFTAAADTGLYTCYINIRTPDSTKAYPIRLHIVPPVTCAAGLAGNYSGSDPCSTDTGEIWHVYTSIVESIPGNSSRVNITNFRGLGDSVLVQAIIGCSTNSIVVPLQTAAGYTFYGTGSYSQAELLIQDTFIHGGDTQICITQLNR